MDLRRSTAPKLWQENGRGVPQSDDMSEYDRYVLQGNSIQLPCPFRGHFRDVLYHFRSEVFEHMRLRLVLAHVSGKLKFEWRPCRLIKLNECLTCLIAAMLLFKIQPRFQPENDRAMKQVAHHTAHELWIMDDDQYTSFQVSGKVPKPPTDGELAMDLWWHCAHTWRIFRWI